jgi:hypothetical protein
MQTVDWLGFVGVFQILLAYFLNVIGRISHQSLVFILLNLIGATMACIASIILDYWPFIILEGIWAIIALYSLIKYKNLKI